MDAERFRRLAGGTLDVTLRRLLSDELFDVLPRRGRIGKGFRERLAGGADPTVIGYCYGTALSDSTGGFWSTLFAMLFSVGLCEELIKLLPVAWLWHSGKLKAPHEIFFVGALSGLGFGVSEGVHYAFDVYRPLEAPFSIYVLRFFGVALGHGLWTVVASIVYWSVLKDRAPKPVGSAETPQIFTWDLACVFASAIPHALYNSLLTHDHAFLAGVTNVVTIWAVTSYLEEQEKAASAAAR